MSSSKKCAVLGDINIDIITPPFTFPKEIGESTVVLDEFVLSLGGNAINVAATLAALKARHKFYGGIGEDPISKWIVDECARLKIITNLKILTERTAGITFAMTLTGGKRQFVATLGTNKLLSEDYLEAEKISKFDHLHRAGFWYTPQLLGNPTISLMKSMISSNKQTSLDVGWDPEGFPEMNIEILYKTLEYSQFFFLNEKELSAITKKTDLNAGINELLQISTSIDDPIIIIHQGAAGSLIASRKEKIKIPTGDIPQNNPTGTGDIYNAGFIYGLLNEWNLKKCGIFADKIACIHLADKTKIYPSINDISDWK